MHSVHLFPLQDYWSSIGYTPVSPPPPASDVLALPNSDGYSAGGPEFPAAAQAVVASVLAVTGLVGLAAALTVHRRRHKARGSNAAPGAGPDTTLVITDIEVSSWQSDALRYLGLGIFSCCVGYWPVLPQMPAQTPRWSSLTSR
jgi:hypothetical protein